MAKKSRQEIRRGVRGRIRKKIQGTEERPRLAIYRSVKHIYAQVINDVGGRTLASASTVDGDFKGDTGGNVEAAKAIGKMIAERAIEAGIKEVVYDRGGYVYHGRVKALIDASREAGLNQNGDSKANGKKKETAETESTEENKPAEKEEKKDQQKAGKTEEKAEETAEAEDSKAEEEE